MKFKLLIVFIPILYASVVHSKTEYTETVPPSVLLRYAAGESSAILFAIGHKPINKKDTFAGFFYEKETVTKSFSVSSLGIIAFNFSQQETPKSGAELRISISETNYGKGSREGLDAGLELHKYVAPSWAIGFGGIIRPEALAYQSSQANNIAEYSVRMGVHYTATEYLKVSGVYRYDAVVMENMEHEQIYNGAQLSISMLF